MNLSLHLHIVRHFRFGSIKVRSTLQSPLPVLTHFEQERQTVARYARLTPSCNQTRNFIAIASIILEIFTGKNLSMKKTQGNNSKIKQARVKVHVHCTLP